MGARQSLVKGIKMKLFKLSIFLLIILVLVACSSGNLQNPTSEPSINNEENGGDENAPDIDSSLKTYSINRLDIGHVDDAIPPDLEEMLVYGEIRLNDQIIYLTDISEFGLDDDNLNDYGLWQNSINRLFCGFEEQANDAFKGTLTSPDGSIKYLNTSMEKNQIDGEGYCVGFNLGTFQGGGPYEFFVELPEIEIKDIFNVYLNTLIVRNWEPNEKIRVITYLHEKPFSPTGNFNSESYFNADDKGELWVEIEDSSSNLLWENNLIAVFMYGESGKMVEFFGEKDYSNVYQKAILPVDN